MQENISFSLGNVGFSIRIKDSVTREGIRMVYKEYITQKRPTIKIDFEYVNKVAKGEFLSLFSQNVDWFYGTRRKDLFIYFPVLPRANKATLIKSDACFHNITVQSESRHTNLFLFHIPVMLLSLYLSQHNGLVMHASGVLNKKRGYLFVAPSEGGKSTLARLALEEGIKVLNGTPWHGEIAVTQNISAIVEKIFFIEKSTSNELKLINKGDAMVKLLKNCFYFPLTGQIRRDYIKCCSKLAEKIKCYELKFQPTRHLWRFLNEHS
jgi:hypothetical protein